ncbi:putative permease membrane region [Bordetella bronchiseptica D993]|uniref:aspartate-alanine antiporter-like transporter n=1 Tax=Bordetella bronchiseptica TaxID=518 RepID=UPI000460E33B|nr:TrkA C-terminal domain-containing protein [Bordetella bronchiseptica]KDB97965.1 putative permease membrane region [Bordetella bronchiseptica D993]
MQAFVQFLGSNPYILLFLTIGLAVWVGKFSIKGYGLGAVAAAIVVGCLVATVGAAYGVKFHLDEFAKSLLYYLFMYGVGLRVGPSFVNALNKESINYAILAIIAPILGLAIVVLGTQFFGLPLGAAGGMLAGSQTMSAAIGSAEQAVSAGVLSLGSESPEEISAMIALSYGITYIWGTVGIILLCKYLPRIWGVDAKAAALEFEKAHGVPNVDDAGLTAFHPFDLRAYRVENPESIGKTVQQFRTRFPQYQVVNVERGDQLLGPSAETVLQQGDVVALGGRLEEMTRQHGGARPRGARRPRAEHTAGPGRDPGDQQGGDRPAAEDLPRFGAGRADPAAARRAQRRAAAHRPGNHAAKARRAVRDRPAAGRQQGRRDLRRDCAP